MAALIEEKEKAECETVDIGSIQVLNALQKKNVPRVPTSEGQASKSEGLLYMEAKLNGKPAHVLMDTGATHNFITMGEAERLGLNVVDGGGWLKTVNAEAKTLQGTIRRVEMCLGKWKGFVNFSVARMDDFKVVLGLDFLRQVNALVSPYNNAVCIMERGAACVVPMFGGTSSTMTSMRLSGMRLVQEVEGEETKKSEGTYLASLKVEDHVAPSTEEPPKELMGVLKGKKDVVLHEFEKRQPPRRKVGDQGKLDRGAKPQNVVPCGMVPPKVEKLSTTSKAKGEIVKLIKEGLQRDPLAKELLQLAKSGKTQRYRVKGDLLYTRDGRVYVPKWRDLRKMVIRGSHDTQSTVHPGHRRTYALVTTAYFWPQMKEEVQMCVKTCHVCRQVKGESQADEAKLLDASQVLHDLQRREAEYVLGDRLEQGRGVPPKQHYLVKWKGLSEHEATWDCGNEGLAEWLWCQGDALEVVAVRDGGYGGAMEMHVVVRQGFTDWSWQGLRGAAGWLWQGRQLGCRLVVARRQLLQRCEGCGGGLLGNWDVGEAEVEFKDGGFVIFFSRALISPRKLNVENTLSLDRKS
ncbi:hypothetical protein RJ640_025065 [Escallonia rubra]|uniref:Chromo domain-containing protein n=1 Tax=Escallonia rubra TaxID=112253 RepID=A0AA88R1U7_9ASTE|nr:hypothetical protein RJ640_025065 [Escallonia rubra]